MTSAFQHCFRNVIRKIQVSQEGLKLNGTLHLLICVNLWGKNLNTVKKHTEALLVVGEAVGLEVNAEKMNYIFVL